MNSTWIAFAAGIFLGGILGMGILAMLVAGRNADEQMEQMHRNRFPRLPRT
jgi:hypothetical protein